MSYLVNKEDPSKGSYDIEEGPEGFRWVWTETAKAERFEDFGAWKPTRAEALISAAEDWDENGSGPNGRFSGMLRALATKAST